MSERSSSPFLGGESHPPQAPLSGRQRVIWDVTDSINYTPAANDVSLARNDQLRGTPFPRLFGITGRTFMALATTLITGILIGITAKLMEQGIVASVRWRNDFIAPWLLIDPLAAVVRHLALASTSVLLTAAVVQWIAPGAAGSGVSLVIALLNGNNIAGLLTPAVYFVKLVGTCVSRMAGLALGPEAPMVHLGACVASLVFAVQRSKSLDDSEYTPEVLRCLVKTSIFKFLPNNFQILALLIIILTIFFRVFSLLQESGEVHGGLVLVMKIGSMI